MADQTHHDLPESQDSPVRGANGANIVLGIWLILAPFVLSYDLPRAIWNDVIVGFLIMIFAGLSIVALHVRWLNWVIVLLGLWLVAAPFVLGYFEPAAIWNDIVLGLIVLILAAWSASATRPMTPQHHHAPR